MMTRWTNNLIWRCICLASRGWTVMNYICFCDDFPIFSQWLWWLEDSNRLLQGLFKIENKQWSRCGSGKTHPLPLVMSMCIRVTLLDINQQPTWRDDDTSTQITQRLQSLRARPPAQNWRLPLFFASKNKEYNSVKCSSSSSTKTEIWNIKKHLHIYQ